VAETVRVDPAASIHLSRLRRTMAVWIDPAARIYLILLYAGATWIDATTLFTP